MSRYKICYPKPLGNYSQLTEQEKARVDRRLEEEGREVARRGDDYIGAPPRKQDLVDAEIRARESRQQNNTQSSQSYRR